MSIVLIVTLVLGAIPALCLLIAAALGLGLRLILGDAADGMFPWSIWGGEPAAPTFGETLDGWARWWVRWGSITGVLWLILLLAVLTAGI